MGISLLAVAAFALASSGPVQDQPRPDPFTLLFASTCMTYFYAPEKLRAEMATRGAGVLQGESARFFLGGKPGTAWSVQGAEGRFVVSWRDDHVCAVFAQRAPVADVHANFASLLAEAPDPLIASPREEAGPEAGMVRTVSIAWGRPDDKTELLFTLTTSGAATSTVQAMASMARVDAPANTVKVTPDGAPRRTR